MDNENLLQFIENEVNSANNNQRKSYRFANKNIKFLLEIGCHNVGKIAPGLQISKNDVICFVLLSQ